MTRNAFDNPNCSNVLSIFNQPRSQPRISCYLRSHDQNCRDNPKIIFDKLSHLLILYQTVIDKMIFFKISTFCDVSNLPKPSWIKGQIVWHCNIIFITLFRIK